MQWPTTVNNSHTASHTHPVNDDVLVEVMVSVSVTCGVCAAEVDADGEALLLMLALTLPLAVVVRDSVLCDRVTERVCAADGVMDEVGVMLDVDCGVPVEAAVRVTLADGDCVVEAVADGDGERDGGRDRVTVREDVCVVVAVDEGVRV